MLSNRSGQRAKTTSLLLLMVLASCVCAQDLQADTEQYARRFGSVLHFAIMRGAPGMDMQKDVFDRLMASMPDELEEVDNDRQQMQGFWPLNPSSDREELIWAERYSDLHDWTRAEVAAQRDPGWITNQVSMLRSGRMEFYSEAQAEDSLEDSPRLVSEPNDPPIAVHWMQLRSDSILPNLTQLPQHVQELNALLHGAGFSDISVKYYGALTAAGSDRTNASIWVEYRTLGAMSEALTFLTTDSAARGWRRNLMSMTSLDREWYLLEAK